MTPFEVYRTYMALKLHFTTEPYDVVQQRGKVRVSRAAFAKRKDLTSIQKIAKTYSDEEVANMLIANFVSGDRFGGIFDNEARDRYIEWKKRIESLTYQYKTDLGTLQSLADNFSSIFDITENQHPLLLRAFLGNAISIETMVILNHYTQYIARWDAEITETIVWPDTSRVLRKYTPLLRFNKVKFQQITNEVLETENGQALHTQ